MLLGSRPGGRPDSRGSVTAELALAMPALIICLTAVLGVGQVVTAHVQCMDAARAAARAAARGENDARAADVGRRVGPAGVQVALAPSGSMVAVRARAPVRLLLPGRPTVAVSAEARAETEGVTGGGGS